MKLFRPLGIFILVAMQPVLAQAAATTSNTSNQHSVCLLAGAPPSAIQYSVIKNLKRGKGSYGSVNDVLVPLIKDARALGADAIINYNGSQRFGFFPWRFVRPVVTGTAVKWAEEAPNCEALGGSYR